MFQPKKQYLNLELMRMQYKKLINEDNIDSILASNISKILKNESAEDRDLFLHHLISKWVDKQTIRDINFIKTLKHIIKKTKIKLTEVDKYELTLLEERSFSEYRHIKVLAVSTELESRETVGIKFEDAQLYVKTSRLTLLHDATLMISNKRIILEISDTETLSFHWTKIIGYSYEDYGFEFSFEGKIYVLRIHDQITLNNTIKNMLSKKLKHIESKQTTTEDLISKL